MNKLKKSVKAFYTFNGEGNILVSEGQSYEIYSDGGKLYIIDNTGYKNNISKKVLKSCFKLSK